MGCETDAPGAAPKCSSGQAISYGLLVACLVLLVQTAFYLTRARADTLSGLEGSEAQQPAITQVVLSLTPPVLFVLAGVIGTVLTVKEILLRNTAVKLVLNLLAALGLVLLFALAVQAVSLPLAESATRLSQLDRSQEEANLTFPLSSSGPPSAILRVLCGESFSGPVA